MKKFLTLAAIALFFSCSEDGGENPVLNDNQVITPNTPTLVKEVKVVPITGNTIITKYEYDGRKIKKIIYSANEYYEFSYNEWDAVSRIEKKVNNALTEYSTFEHNSSDYIMTRTRYVLNSNGQPPTVYISNISYPLMNTKFVVSTFAESNPVSDTYSYTKTITGNITFKEHSSGTNDNEYTYDNKFSPFAGIADFNNMQVLYPYINKQNVITDQNYINGVYAGKYKYEYIYNENNFAIEAKKYNNATNELIETITYTY
jgi:hypothetical protein